MSLTGRAVKGVVMLGLTLALGIAIGRFRLNTVPWDGGHLSPLATAGVTVSMENEALQDVLFAIESSTREGIYLILDERASKASGIEPTTRVSLHCGRVPVQVALANLTRGGQPMPMVASFSGSGLASVAPLGSSSVSDWTLELYDVEPVARLLWQRRRRQTLLSTEPGRELGYDRVSTALGILREPYDPIEGYNGLKQLVIDSIDSDSWRDNGAISYHEGFLLITAKKQTHLQIRRLLDRMITEERALIEAR